MLKCVSDYVGTPGIECYDFNAGFLLKMREQTKWTIGVTFVISCADYGGCHEAPLCLKSMVLLAVCWGNVSPHYSLLGK